LCNINEKIFLNYTIPGKNFKNEKSLEKTKNEPKKLAI